MSMIYLEGTDGVGKTTTIDRLKKYGIICEDRNKEVISHNMLFDISMDKRTKIYEKYLKENDVIIIFLINNDEKELMKRIYSREKIGDFDLEAYRYNQLYLDTYNFMLENNMTHDRLYLIDCTNLSIEEQTNRVKELLERLNA